MEAALWLTLPTYNEAENIDPLLRAVVAELRTAAPGRFRVVVVDDNSPDGTADIAEGVADELPEVEVLRRTVKDGLGAAYLAGFRHAVDRGAELVMVMDSDFSHDPSYLPALIEAAEDADLVLGSRYVRGGGVADWPPIRRVLSRGGGLYARTILGVSVRDLTGGFRCIRREVLEAIEPGTLRSQGYVFNIEFTYRAVLAGFRVREVPIVFHDRRAGTSKMSLPIAFEALSLVPALRRQAPRFRVEHATEAFGAPQPELPAAD
jgi:dolichol-phosphate mannosyltransferase